MQTLVSTIHSGKLSMMQADTRSKNKGVVSVAVKIGRESTLFKLNQVLPLEEIIEQLCKDNNVEYVPNQYALQVTDTKEGNINKYITEGNRTAYITNGSELRLIFSAKEMCKIIHDKILKDDDLQWGLEKLNSLSGDRTFSEEFTGTYGIDILVSLIQRAKPPYETLHLCIETIVSFLSFHLIPNLEAIPVEYVVNVMSSVGTYSLPECVIESALKFLKKILKSKRASETLMEYIKEKITFDTLVPLLCNKNNPCIQERTLAFINIISSGESSYPLILRLASKDLRDIISTNILSNSSVSSSLAHELYIYQTLVLKLLSSKLNTNIEPESAEALSLQELNDLSYTYEQHIKRDSAVSLLEDGSIDKTFSNSSSPRTSSAYEFDINSPTVEKPRFFPLQRSISEPDSETEQNECFMSHHHPETIVWEVSILTLDCMLYFARKNRKTYTKIMLMEEKVQRKPFHIICDRLVHLLCDVLEVGKKPSKDSTCYQPLLFEASEESPFFEELFCCVAIRLNSTSREMKARTSQDHEKVMKVLRHQITAVLQKQLNTWKKFEELLRGITYEKVVETWQSQNDQNVMKLQDLPAVIELRDRMRPEIEELISQQRLNLLCRGTQFIKANTRTQKLKKKYWYIFLSPNHTVFHYGDCNDRDSQQPECVSKVSVSSITELVVGKKCPHVREAKNNRKPEPELAFSLILDQSEPASLDFIAPTQEIYDCWTDGLSVLLGNKMRSKMMETEMKILLDMEVRLHLLELEGIDIPHSVPPVPKAPLNFDFIAN